MTPRTLVARLDNAGDVLLAGPAVRAVAASGRSVVFLAGPSGAAAANLLPGVDEVVTWSAPWVADPPSPMDADAVYALIDVLAARPCDEALILTSFHQSALPLALVLRLAGVARLAATSVDYPGALLDARVAYDHDLHEVEQQLAVAAALGHHLPPDDSGALAIEAPALEPALRAPYVVIHPGASVPARALPPTLAIEVAQALVLAGWKVVITGSPLDQPLADAMVRSAGGGDLVNLVGSTSFEDLAGVLAAARAIVVGNTGPAHLAAAVGTPVVEVFAATVDPRRWAPWRVPHRLLGHLDIRCAGCRARRCPVPDRPCVSGVSSREVVGAVEALAGSPLRNLAARST